MEIDNICIVGSATLAVRDLRENGDIDICFVPSMANNGNWLLPENISSSPNKYEHIGISDSELVRNEMYHDVVDGYKIIRPEIEYFHKKIRDWDKDRDDVELLEQYRKESADWNPELIVDDYTPGGRHLLRRGWASLRRDGLQETLNHGVKYLRWYGPFGNDARYSGQATTIPQKAVRSLRQDGLEPTLTRGIRLVKLKEPTGLLDRYTGIRHKAKLATLAERKLDLRYPTAALLTEQYDGDSFTRMDLMVRLLAAEALLQNEEPPAVITDFETASDEPVVDELRSLLETPSTVGDRPTVPIGYDSAIRDANALAVALAESVDAPAVDVAAAERRPKYDRSWFEANGFDAKQLKVLDERFSKLLLESATLFPLIIWPPAQSHAEKIVDAIRDEKRVRYTTHMSFSDEQFEEFVWALYESQEDLNMDHIEDKIERMADYEKEVRVVGVEIPNPEIREGFAAEMFRLKEGIREQFTPKILAENPSENLLIHAADNFEHNRETWNIIEQFAPTTNLHNDV